MRKNIHALRFDHINSHLEDRIVPSAPATGVLQAIEGQYIQQFQSGYADVARSFVANAGSTLFKDGDTGIAGNRSAFNTEIFSSISALEYDVNAMLALSPLASIRLTPAIDASLVDGAGSLKGQLASLPNPTDTDGGSAAGFGMKASTIIDQSLQSAINELEDFFSANNPDRVRAANAGLGGSSQDIIQAQYRRHIQLAFAELAQGYASTASSGLFASPEVAVIAQGRAKFDATVQGGVDAITSDITAKLAISPRAASSLIPGVQDRLIGAGPSSLLSQLKALPTPTDVDGASAQAFGQSAINAITSAYQDVDRMLGAFASEPRPALAGSPGNGLGIGSGDTSGTSGAGGNLGTGTGTGTGSGTGVSIGTGTSVGSGGSIGTGGSAGTGSSVATGTGGGTRTGTGSAVGTLTGGTSTGSAAATTGFINGFNIGLGPAFGTSLPNGFSPSTTAGTAGGSVISAPGPNPGFGGGFNGFGNSFAQGIFGGFTPGSGVGFNPTNSFGTGFTGGFTPGFNQAFGSGFNNGFGSNASSAFGPGYNAGFGAGSSSNFSPNYSTGLGSGSNNGSTTGFGTGYGAGYGMNASGGTIY